MVDISDYAPRNPLTAELPLQHRVYPDVDWNLARAEGEDSLADVDPVRAGVYAWGIYGVLCVTNYAYYGDRFYWNYVVNPNTAYPFHFRNVWRFAAFLRDFSLMALWTAASLSWALSALGNRNLILFFEWVSTLLVNVTILRIFWQVILHCLALVVDNYAFDPHVFNYWDEKVWGFANRQIPATAKVYRTGGEETAWMRQPYYSMDESNGGNRRQPLDYAWLDFMLEAFNIGTQLVAYPLLQLGVREGLRTWSQRVASMKEREAEAEPAPAPVEEEVVVVPEAAAPTEEQETDSWL